jgi:hypothetical protein
VPAAAAATVVEPAAAAAGGAEYTVLKKLFIREAFEMGSPKAGLLSKNARVAGPRPPGAVERPSRFP